MASTRYPARTIRLLALALACAAIAPLAALPTQATARKATAAKLSITSPPAGGAVKGVVRYAVRAGARRRVSFYVDGKRQAVRRVKRAGRSFRRAIRFDSTHLNDGKHRLKVVQRDRHGRRRVDRQAIFVTNAPPKRRHSTAASGRAIWSASFEGADGPTLSEWTSTERDDGGTFFATDAAGEGIPAHGGSGVARFEVTAADQADERVHSKLYKSWALAAPETSWRDDEGRLLQPLPGGTPGGVYSAWYFLPADYRANEDWVNIFQFKEGYLSRAGDEDSWEQDPSWWVNLFDDEGAPSLIINRWSDDGAIDQTTRRAPLGRWFEIRADLHPGDRIDWSLDGQPWFTSTQAMYPVGLFQPNSTGWTFGVGHYGGVGKLWVDDASYTAR